MAEIGTYTTKDGREFRIYTDFAPGGVNIFGIYVAPGETYNLEVNGHGALWAWMDWLAFANKVNQMAGECILTLQDKPEVDAVATEVDVFETVPVQDGCPNCGNTLMDLLPITQEDEPTTIRCLVCQTVYNLPE